MESFDFTTKVKIFLTNTSSSCKLKQDLKAINMVKKNILTVNSANVL